VSFGLKNNQLYYNNPVTLIHIVTGFLFDELMPVKPHLEKHSPNGQKERVEMMGMLEE
tara:strand:+ start:948 stop:1121 length:174 start_codon:yes stop_codon:yes gene_type:complete